MLARVLSTLLNELDGIGGGGGGGGGGGHDSSGMRYNEMCIVLTYCICIMVTFLNVCVY